MKIARHWKTVAEQAVEAKLAKDKAEAEEQLALLEPAVEKEASEGKLSLVYTGKLSPAAIAMLIELGYGAKERQSEGNFPGSFSTVYDISWKDAE